MQILTNVAKVKLKEKHGDAFLAARPIPMFANPDFDNEQEPSELNPKLIAEYTESQWIDIVAQQLFEPVFRHGDNILARKQDYKIED